MDPLSNSTLCDSYDKDLGAVYDSIPISIFLVNIDDNGNFTFGSLNPTHENAIGLSNKDIVGKAPEEIPGISEEGAAALRANYQRCVDTNDIISYEEFFELYGVKTHWLTKLTPVHDIAGKIIQIIGYSSNITARKETENAIKESEENYRRIVEITNEGILKIDVTMKVAYVNQRVSEMLGYTTTELLGRPIIDFVHKDYHDNVRAYFARRQAGISEQVEMCYRCKNGVKLWAIVNSVPIVDEQNQFAGVLAMLTDITERKNVELALRRSEAQLESILKVAPSGIGLMMNRIFVWVNKQMVEISGYTEDELMNQSARMIYASDEEFERVGRLKYQQIAKQGTGTIESKWKRKDGKIIDVLLSSAPIDKNDLSAGVTFTALDITERKLAENELKSERDRMQKYLSIAGVVFLVLDKQGSIRMINNKGCEILECEEDEIIGKNWFDEFIKESDRDNLKSVFSMVMCKDLKNVEYNVNSVITKSGHTRTIAWHNSMLTDNNGNVIGTLSSGEDITERIKLESQLMRSQKMDAIGKLAAGIAHDFNNILTAINGFAELSIKGVDKGSSVAGFLEEIKTAGNRAASLTGQLLAFSRKQMIEPKILNINNVIRDLGNMLQRLLSEDIKLNLLLADEECLIKADVSQIEQVLVNLTINSRDAILDNSEPNRKSEITIETRKTVLDDTFCTEHLGCTPGLYINITVSDTGKGISAENLDRVFEPFFTTKPKDKGTGLGLSTVYGIVKQNYGYIVPYSAPGAGAAFQIYWPIVTEELADQSQKGSSTNLPGGMETILVVEDDTQILNFVQQVLTAFGYNVIVARNGTEALGIAEHNLANIDLLFTDVVMPEMGGKEIADILKQQKPDLKVLFSSGYTEDQIAKRGILNKDVIFLHKPYSTDALARKIRDVLDNKIPSS
ncbi:MAG: PAS domain S-box protein [Gammaproteobacteria bacterium]|nr:PAS domain S-box protein [Gammaproteobacteria bacterium]